MIKRIPRNELRKRRHKRVRKKVFGTDERPRLCVFRSNKHIYAQVINDLIGHTLVSASSLEIKGDEHKTKTEMARAVGLLIGRRCLEKGIRKVVYDRGGYKYHGRVKALADGAREAGLEF